MAQSRPDGEGQDTQSFQAEGRMQLHHEVTFNSRCSTHRGAHLQKRHVSAGETDTSSQTCARSHASDGAQEGGCMLPCP